MAGEKRGERDFLCVDEFIRDAVGARALASALELGIIDALADADSCEPAELGARAGLDRRGLELLTGMLRAAGVVEGAPGRISLAAGFRAALGFRDLLEAKLDFAAAVAPDFMGLFTTLLADPAGFFEKAGLFELFSYDRCFDPTPENLAATARWMRFTTALTRYESAACIARHDFSRHRRMLDVGGNSGEFALQVCIAHPGVRATVFDLPLVCDIGERHVGRHAAGERIAFVRASRDEAGMPAGFDLVTFKSMLHDWPDERMQTFLARAFDAIEPGGTLLIFERSRVEVGARQFGYAQVPLLLFFRAYRSAGDYRAALVCAGFVDVCLQEIELDMRFMLLSATKPTAR